MRPGPEPRPGGAPHGAPLPRGRGSRPGARRARSVACAGLALFLLLHAAGPGRSGAAGPARLGSLGGRVVEAAAREPLPGATVQVVGLKRGAHADSSGAFLLVGMPPGRYELLVTHIGYEPAEVEAEVGLTPGGPPLEVRLTPSSVRLPGVVVSATRRPQSLARAPLSIAVAASEDLGVHNAFTLASPLKYVAGVSQVGSHVNIRGSSGYSRGVGSRVLLLLDGTPLLSADSGDIKWDIIPPGQVERVEVVKGAGSALYGTGALGGVINVITRGPAAAPETRYRALAGAYSQPAYDSWQWRDEPMWLAGAEVSHSRTAGGVGLVLAAGHRRTVGYQENDDFRRYNAYARAQGTLSARSAWSGLAAWSLDDHGTFLQWRTRTQPLRVPDSDAAAATLSWKLAAHAALSHLHSPRTSWQVKAFYFRTEVDNNRAAGDFNTTGHKVGAEVQVDHSRGAGLRLIAGTSAVVDAVRSPADFAGSRAATSLAAFGQAVARPQARVEVAAGLRLDLHGRDAAGTRGSDLCPAAAGRAARWQEQVSPQLGLSWRPRAGTDLRASVGRGFRAPSITEAHAQASASGVLVCPNPAVAAEKSWSWELGLRQALGPHQAVDAALFWNEYEDLVEARPEPELDSAIPRASFRNLSEARVRGLEVEHRAALPGGFLWRAAYTFLDAVEFPRPGESLPPYCADDLVPGQRAPLPYRARHQAAAEVRGRRGPLAAGATWRYISRFERVSGLFPECRRDFLPVYLVDVFAAWRRGAVEVRARIDNLLNYHYVLAERELRPLRRLSLSLSGTL